MSQHVISPEITFNPPLGNTKRIWSTFWILSVLTIIELGLGLTIDHIHKGVNPSAGLVLFIKGVITILTLAKAYYIIAVFMHLGDEIRNLIMTVAMPMLLFVWFIIAFLWDGHSFKVLRNSNGGASRMEQSIKVAPPATTPIEKGAKD